MNIIRKALCVLLAGSLLLSVHTTGFAADEDALRSNLDAINQKLAAIDQQKKEIKNQLAEVKDEKSKAAQECSNQEAELDVTKQEIELLDERIEFLEQDIENKLDEVDAKQKEINASFEQYKKRMRAMYMAGESSTISMVLGAADYSDLLMRTELVRSSAQRDKELLEEMRASKQALEEAKKKLDESKQSLGMDMALLDESRKEMEDTLGTLQQSVLDIALEEEYYKKNQKQLDAQYAQLQKEMDSIYEQLKPKMSTSEFVGGEFAWPVPGHYQVTSTYGDPGRSDNHTGTDIAGGSVYGKPVIAANDGTVILTTSSNSGYGKYVIVDHGGGYTTLYAHMSAISVSVGQAVQKGTTQIGAVGSTGWATGPHLHFEVRINGKPVNALSYIKG